MLPRACKDEGNYGRPENASSLSWRAQLAIRDRVPLVRTNIDVPTDQGGPVVEDGFEVEAAVGRPIVYMNESRRGRCQKIIAQEILLPTPAPDRRGVDFDNGHPCIIGDLDLPV